MFHTLKYKCRKATGEWFNNEFRYNPGSLGDNGLSARAVSSTAFVNPVTILLDDLTLPEFDTVSSCASGGALIDGVYPTDTGAPWFPSTVACGDATTVRMASVCDDRPCKLHSIDSQTQSR